MLKQRLRSYGPNPPGTDWPDSFHEPGHIKLVNSEIELHLDEWILRFLGAKVKNQSPFAASFKEYADELQIYERLLSAELLDDFGENPGGFKDYLKRECPVIRSTLNAPGEEFDRYRTAFKHTSGEALLKSVRGIAAFAREYIAEGGPERHDTATALEDLDLEGVETLGAEGVIGTGIMSLFMHMISPAYFPVRSKDGLIGIYFLTGKKYGLLLVERPERMGRDEGLPLIETNWKYPYERFVSHSAVVYRRLKEAIVAAGHSVDEKFRYRYVEAFLSFIADATKDYRRQTWRETKFNKWSSD